MKQPDSQHAYRIAARSLHWIALGLIASLVLIVASMYWLARPLMQAVRVPALSTLPPAPRLQAHPELDLAAERAREEAALKGYLWIDRERGIARIPIERAMALLAAQAADAPRAGPQSAAAHASPAAKPSVEGQP